MNRLENIFNYFFLLGLCPFKFKSHEITVPRFYVVVVAIKFIFGVLASCFTIYTVRGYLFRPKRLDVSFLTMVTTIGTILIDYLVLQILLMNKIKLQEKLLRELFRIQRIMDVVIGPVADEAERKKVYSIVNIIKVEVILKSILFSPIPGIICYFYDNLEDIVIIFSFFAMLYSILFLFVHNRIFLVLLNQSIDRYVLYIEDEENPVLPPEIIIKCIREFHDFIGAYNRTFRYQNMILAQCAFMILLLLFYMAAAIGGNYHFGVSAMFIPAIFVIGYDIGMLVWYCHTTNTKLDQIRRIHSRQLDVDDNPTDFSVRLFFLHQMPQFACGNLSVFNNGFLLMVSLLVLS